MAWTAPATWVNGVAVTAADLNQQIRDNLAYLKGQAGSPYIEEGIELPEQLTGSTPAAGTARVFIGNASPNDGIASCVDDAGNVTQMITYGRGTFTPTFVGTGTAGTFTYVAGRQDGRYTRLGDMILFSIEIAISAISVAPTGSMTIAGLPFAAAGNQDGSVAFGLIASLDLTANCVQLTGFIASGTSVIDLREVFDNAGSTAYPAANFTNTSAQLRLTGMYWVTA